MKPRLIAYTSITNDKDHERSDILSMAGYEKFLSPVMNAKIYKILAHKFLDCEISFWMDGNIRPIKPIPELVEMWLRDNDIALFRHYKHKNIDWELKMIKRKFAQSAPIALEAERQIEYYIEAGLWPDIADVFMGGVIIRRHTPLVARFNEAWWAEICCRGQRDQLSLPVIIKQFPELKITRIEENIKRNPYMEYYDHKHYLS